MHQLFDYAADLGFCDPMTGCPPRTERNLSGLLAFYAQRQSIDWSRVRLYDSKTFQPIAVASDLFSYPGTFLSEYVLPHRNQAEGNVWGDMPADLLFISSDRSTVVLVENKIGSKIGYEQTPETNQLARQIDFLVNVQQGNAMTAAFVLISPLSLLEDERCYRSALTESLRCNQRCDKVSGFVMIWEEVLKAVRP